MIEYVVDAHALVWMLEGNPRLGPSARAVLGDPLAALLLPATALAEACWAVSKGRTSLRDWLDVVAVVEADPRISVVPLDAVIIKRAMALAVALEMHDGQIVATGLVRADGGLDVRMLTADRSITDSHLLPVVW